MGKVIQCNHCGRTGDGLIPLGDNLIHCKYCGADTPLNPDYKSFFGAEVDALRVVLAERILKLNKSFKEYENEIDETAVGILGKPTGDKDVLAKLCHSMIYTERLVENARGQDRQKVLSLLEGSDIANDVNGDLKCTVVFLTYYCKYKELDSYYRDELKKRLENLARIVKDKGIDIPVIETDGVETIENDEEEAIPVGEILKLTDEIVSAMAYRNNLNIHGVALAESVRRIGDSAFEGCRNLTYVQIANGVEVIGGSAFCGTGISHLTIPASVKQIGACAFRSCASLSKVVFEDTTGWVAVALNDASKNVDSFELIGRMAVNSLTKSNKYANCKLIKRK